MIQALRLVKYNVQMFHANPELQRVLTMWGTSVATQTAGTLLIVYRELSTPSYVPTTKTPRYFTLAAITFAIIDSGAMYTIGIIFTLAFYTAGRAEGAILAAIVAQISVRAGHYQVLCDVVNFFRQPSLYQSSCVSGGRLLGLFRCVAHFSRAARSFERITTCSIRRRCIWRRVTRRRPAG